MAAIQEHLMNFRGKPEECVEKALRVLKGSQEKEEMSVTEWLYKLNLPQYVSKFINKGIFFRSEIKAWVKDEEIN